MRPCPGKLAEQKRVFNYRLSRKKKNWKLFRHPSWKMEDIFDFYRGICSKCWEVQLACIALHKYLRQANNPSYRPNLFVDCEDITGDIKGGWRKIFTERNDALANLPNVSGSRYKDDAVYMRCCLMRYLNEDGWVDWQLNRVRRT